MTSPLQSLIASGTKLWLDSIDPQLIVRDRALGATGATSNPIIIADLIKSGRFDPLLTAMLARHQSDEDVAWALTDRLVRDAQASFLHVWLATNGDDGYVSFELDPLLEDSQCRLAPADRTARYVELGRQWSRDQCNRMIKVPATEAGLAALEDLAASGVTVNVTLVFTRRQYEVARDALWRGARRRGQLDQFKSVYSIFVSRVDVYTEKHVPQLSAPAQGMVGIVNAKQIWKLNQDFWADKGLPRRQEIVFASTGVKKKEDPQDKYVAALAGSDIQTNPPATNEAVQVGGGSYRRQVHELPPRAILDEIAREVDMVKLESVLMDEGVRKFAEPQKQLLELLARKRKTLG